MAEVSINSSLLFETLIIILYSLTFKKAGSIWPTKGNDIALSTSGCELQGPGPRSNLPGDVSFSIFE